LALIGCGINIGPCSNLASLADIFLKDKTSPRPEAILAKFLNEFEKLYEELNSNPANVVNSYLDLWLHSNQKVFVESEGRDVIIQGIDEYGYLMAKIVDSNESIKLQPDGNSFDIMANLIKIKADKK
jgi:biotin--protein ligase